MATMLAAVLHAAAFVLPRTALACSCDARGAQFSGDEDAVVLGRVGNHVVAGRYAFEIERWFKGPGGVTVQLQSAAVPLGGGAVQFNTCGLELAVGSRLILAASDARGWLDPSVCSPHADANSAEGQALIAAAERTFGSGFVPGDPPAEQGPNDLATIAIGAATAAAFVIALLAGLGLLRRRSRRGIP
jgi:hypothetical protein